MCAKNSKALEENRKYLEGSQKTQQMDVLQALMNSENP